MTKQQQTANPRKIVRLAQQQQPVMAAATAPRQQRRPLLPVLGPLAALIALTGAWRMGQTLPSLLSGANVKGASVGIGDRMPQRNPTEETIAGYARAARLAAAGNDDGALAALETVDGRPLVVDGGIFSTKEMSAYSPSVHLMRAAAAFAGRARAAAQVGDADTAGRWLDACRAMSAHIANAEQPTIEALNVLHYVDEQAARARLAVLEAAPDRGGALRHLLERQRTAINAFWRDSVLTELRQTWESREAHAASAGVALGDPAVVRQERDLANRLMTRYLAEQARLQGMAASAAALVPPSA